MAAETVGSGSSSLSIVPKNGTAGHGEAYQIYIESESLGMNFHVPVNPLTVEASKTDTSVSLNVHVFMHVFLQQKSTDCE